VTCVADAGITADGGCALICQDAASICSCTDDCSLTCGADQTATRCDGGAWRCTQNGGC
jgi:hypothetical protein